MFLIKVLGSCFVVHLFLLTLHGFPSQKRDFAEESASVLSAVSDLLDENAQPQRKADARLQVRVTFAERALSHQDSRGGGGDAVNLHNSCSCVAVLPETSADQEEENQLIH